MKTNHLITLTCLTIIGFLGCSTPPKSTTDAKNQAEAGGTKTRDDLRPIIKAGRPIELPANHQHQFTFKQPTALVNLEKVEMKEGQVPKGIEKRLSSMLEAEVAIRMGRFNIFSNRIYGNEATAPPKIDLFLTTLYSYSRGFIRESIVLIG